jgi:hypothetical protein
MKRYPPSGLFLFLFLAAASAGAQETPAWHSYPWTLGGGTELNQGSKFGLAQGFSLAVDRVFFNRRFAVGLRASMDNDYRTVSNFSGALSLRLYPFTLGPGGAFAQFSFGLGSWQEDGRSALTPVMDFSAGFRYFFRGGFYAEAYLGSGFPAQWAAGLLAGHSFTF